MELTKFDTIRLETPDTLGGKPLMTALQNRKSDRQFETKNLSLKHLSEILWAANGINRKNGKRTVPSAMALYPLQTYALLANGIYFTTRKSINSNRLLRAIFVNLPANRILSKALR